MTIFAAALTFLRHRNGVSFPGKIAKLDRAIVDPLLDVLQHNKEVGKCPSAMFDEQRAHQWFRFRFCATKGGCITLHGHGVRGVHCPGRGVYFAFDGVDDASTTTTTQTGTAFTVKRYQGWNG